jgi:hypothetical protein
VRRSFRLPDDRNVEQVAGAKEARIAKGGADGGVDAAGADGCNRSGVPRRDGAPFFNRIAGGFGAIDEAHVRSRAELSV